MNTSLIRKIIASNLPRKEQDLLILLVVDYDQKNTALDDYYRENEPECSETDYETSDCESRSESDISTVKSENGLDCDDRGYNKAVRTQYEERHGRIMSQREIDADADAEQSISRDDSKVWGLQFPSHTIWGNWTHSYAK